MLKKTLVLLTVAVLLVGSMVVPAMAAPDVSVIDYRDYVAGRDIDGSRYLNELSFPVSMNKWYISAPSSGKPTLGRTGVNPMSFNTQYIVNEGDQAIEVLYKPTDKTLFSLTNIPKGSSFIVDYSFKVSSNYSYSAIVNGSVRVYYYDKDRNVIDYQLVSGGSDKYGDPVSDTHVKADTLFYNFAVDLTPPAGSRYMDFRFYLRPSVFYSNIDGNTHYSNTEFTYELVSSSKLYLAINTAYADGEIDRENSEKLDEMIDQNDNMLGQQEQINDNLETLPGEIGDEFQDIIDKENQSASDTGDNAAGELMDIIPNESQGFMNAIKSLVSAMSYNGTAAKLPIPSITLPEIPGVMSAIKLTDKQEVDFGFWIQKLPTDILQLVRILCTMALIVYCFKELYSTISYALTLKGGKSDE